MAGEESGLPEMKPDEGAGARLGEGVAGSFWGELGFEHEEVLVVEFEVVGEVVVAGGVERRPAGRALQP